MHSHEKEKKGKKNARKQPSVVFHSPRCLNTSARMEPWKVSAVGAKRLQFGCHL